MVKDSLKNIVIIVIGTVIAGLILAYFFGIGSPSEKEKEEPERISIGPIPVTPKIYASDLVNIENLEPQREIYSFGDNATVEFTINSLMNTSYNFTVFWFAENKTIDTWSNQNNITKSFTAYYSPSNIVGTWEVQVIVNWMFQNITFEDAEITTYRVYS